jgi:protein TonB
MRWLFALAATTGINLLLLLLMARLIASDAPRLDTYPTTAQRVEIVQLRREPTPPASSATADAPRPTPAAPRLPPLPAPTSSAPRLAPQKIAPPTLELPLRLPASPFIGAYRPEPPATAPAPAAATEVAPLLRINPRYPRRALRAGIEGEVTVELIVQADGSVSDPRILRAQPADLFEDAVLRAVLRWRFAPKMADGKAVVQRVTQTIRFTLNNTP